MTESYRRSEQRFRSALEYSAIGQALLDGHGRIVDANPALARRAWQEFFSGDAGLDLDVAARARRVEGSAVLKPVDEAPVSTNGTAQWGLAAIQNLALAGDMVEAVFAARR